MVGACTGGEATKLPSIIVLSSKTNKEITKKDLLQVNFLTKTMLQVPGNDVFIHTPLSHLTFATLLQTHSK